ncbi:MAG: hypothetical protein HW388_696 [Dehalococcoidia bacterium]|nr:hypothetical protein [Dehalococcoidia bacterium]
MARFLKSRRVQAPPLYYRGIPVVNLLPSQSRLGVFGQVQRHQMVVRWALVLVLQVGAFTAWNLDQDAKENEQSLSEVTASLTRGKNNLKRVAELESAIAGVEQEKGRLQGDWEELTTQTPGLVTALEEVFRSRSPEVTLRSVNATPDGQIRIQGETSYVPALLTWQERLTASVANLRMVDLRLGGSVDNILFDFTSNMKLVQ